MYSFEKIADITLCAVLSYIFISKSVISYLLQKLLKSKFSKKTRIYYPLFFTGSKILNSFKTPMQHS